MKKRKNRTSLFSYAFSRSDLSSRVCFHQFFRLWFGKHASRFLEMCSLFSCTSSMCCVLAQGFVNPNRAHDFNVHHNVDKGVHELVCFASPIHNVRSTDGNSARSWSLRLICAISVYQDLGGWNDLRAQLESMTLHMHECCMRDETNNSPSA